MAVKCNIPGLALRQVQGLIYGFSCDNVNGDIVRNYLEYLHCPTVDYFICQDFPCEESQGTVFCSVDSVAFALVSRTINTAVISFTPPSQNYQIQLIKVSDGSIINTQQNPTSPITYTGLIPATNYKAKLTLFCPGGETKTVEFPFLTMPTCVVITDYTAAASDVNQYT